ncbi:MAG: Yop proteins translocation protein K [Planctomycetaceae bacterium]|nr:Yop proteins translocation protein K [Planctomycetaceae bacterium]
MDRHQVKEWITSHDRRHERLCAFNTGLVRELPRERLPQTTSPQVWDLLLGSRAAVRRLSGDLRWLSTDFPSGWVGLPEPRHRLAMMPWPELRKALFWFAMAVRFTAVRRCVDGRELRRMAENAGNGARGFALERGNVMIGPRLRALFPDSVEAGLGARVEAAAAAAYAACMQDAPADLAFRGALLLPSWFAKRVRLVRHFDETERRLVWSGVKKVITREALPEWATFFS